MMNVNVCTTTFTVSEFGIAPNKGPVVNPQTPVQTTHGSGKYSDYLLCVAANSGKFLDPPTGEDYESVSKVSRSDSYLVPTLALGTRLFGGSVPGILSAVSLGVLEVSAGAYINQVCTALVYH
jgi:hypothetical protein